MAGSPAAQRRYGSIILSLSCIAVAAAVGWSLFAKRADSLASAQKGEVTGSIGQEAPKPVGPSGYPIPRFVSLKAEKVNVRRGPSSDHPVAWVFQRKGLPVEIVAEFENWRRIRDSDGEEGAVVATTKALGHGESHKPPSFSVERSRSQALCRTGLRGPGQSHRIPYGPGRDCPTEAAAVRQANAWVMALRVTRGL